MLFEAHAVALYERVLEAGRLENDDPLLAADGPDRAAFELLVDVGMLRASSEGDAWHPMDPSLVQAQIVGPLGQQGAELLHESSQWARTFATLSQSWRRSPQIAQGPYMELRGDAIEPFIAATVADAEAELLTAQPRTGHSRSLAAAARRDSAALQRGVVMRTLYQHAARRQATTHKYVAMVSDLGAQVRTLDEFFMRLIVVDRRVAVVPTHDGEGALVVREPSMVAYLVDMFERSWERGRPFTNAEATVATEIAEEQRAMTIRMLVAGHADTVSAKRLGVSARTYAAYVADLKQEFEVDTRFQLGYALARAGLSGHETTSGA